LLFVNDLHIANKWGIQKKKKKIFQPHYGPKFTQPLAEMATRNHPVGGETRPARKTENLNIIYEPTLYKKVGSSAL
jgi:hypothetical protein